MIPTRWPPGEWKRCAPRGWTSWSACGAAEAELGNEAWLTAVRLGRPHVLWKLAATLDGRVAAADGTSRWITGEAARADAHRVRDGVDAVLVGTGTALADDPRSRVRIRGDGGVDDGRSERPRLSR